MSFSYNFILSTDMFFQRLLYIFFHIFIAIFKYPIWILFFVLYLINYNKKFTVIYYSLSSLAFILITYTFIDIKDYQWLIAGSLDRIIFQSSGFLIVFISYSLDSIFRNFKNNKKIN